MSSILAINSSEIDVLQEVALRTCPDSSIFFPPGRIAGEHCQPRGTRESGKLAQELQTHPILAFDLQQDKIGLPGLNLCDALFKIATVPNNLKPGRTPKTLSQG